MTFTSDIQVDPTHYSWGTYTDKARWCSYWHQIDEVIAISPKTCVEIGVGTGDVNASLTAQGVKVTTVDIDPALNVDRVGGVTALPCTDNEFDVALCAQVLEHLPYDQVPGALAELARVAGHRVVVSLPMAGRPLRAAVTVPVLGARQWVGRTPGRHATRFNGQHYWEVGAPKARKHQVRALIHRFFVIEKEYQVFENPYHRFYVLTPR